MSPITIVTFLAGIFMFIYCSAFIYLDFGFFIDFALKPIIVYLYKYTEDVSEWTDYLKGSYEFIL